MPPKFDDETDRKMCIILSKGTLDGAYPALILANAALGEGIETHLFFTFWGMDVITKDKLDHLKVTPVGNTSMPIPQALAPLPGMIPMATHMMKKQIDDLDVPDVPEFLGLLRDAGAYLWACRMSADMMKLEMPDFVDGVKDIISAGDFMDLSQDAQILFI